MALVDRVGGGHAPAAADAFLPAAAVGMELELKPAALAASSAENRCSTVWLPWLSTAMITAAFAPRGNCSSPRRPLACRGLYMKGGFC